ALVFNGRGIGAEDAAVDLRGAVSVVALPGSGATRDYRFLLAAQAERAQRDGASAIIHILDPQWSASGIEASATGATRARRRLGADPGFPQIYLRFDAARTMLAAAGLDIDDLWRKALLGETPPIPLRGVTVAAQIPEEFLDRATAPNVVAMWEGSDPVL